MSMQQRQQQTIGKAVEVEGIGFLTGADVRLRLNPAESDFGIAFQRVDVDGSKLIPATIDFAAKRSRRTAIENDGVAVELVEHVMAALYALQIDNCLVQLNAPEPPGFDGSAQAVVDGILSAGTVEQGVPRHRLVVSNSIRVTGDHGNSEIVVRAVKHRSLVVSYHLDYGSRSPIPAQMLTLEITPESFVRELACSRTFVLQSEVEALRAQGYGSRLTEKDLLVFGEQGVIGNRLRAPNECVRHKILDCVGDLALIGAEVHGHINAYRSGHGLNREMVRMLRISHPSWQAVQHESVG